MPEQRKRLHCVAEITLSTTFLLASEVPAIAAFARSGLPQDRNSKTRQRRGSVVPRSRVGLPKRGVEYEPGGRCYTDSRPYPPLLAI